jgi:hypothetical protein
MKRTLLTLALIATAGVAQAQTMSQPMSQPQPMARPMTQPMPSAEPLDPNGRPFIGRNDWVRQPGDQMSGSAGANARGNVGGAGASTSADIATAPSGPREATFKDEFGFRYDAQGNRLDARGNIISPQTR